MANSADPDQLASVKPTDLDLHCLLRQCISGFSRTMVKYEVTWNVFKLSFVRHSHMLYPCAFILDDVLLS